MGALDEGHYFNGELHNGIKLNLRYLEEQEEQEQEQEQGETPPITAAIEDAVKILLHGLGEDSNREGLKKTPLRVAKALTEGTRGYRQKVKDIVQGALFPEAGFDSGVGQAGGAGGLVVVRDLDLFSYCESCLLPFQVKCHVGYVPSGQRVVGLSKLSRVADVFAKRLQDPKRLADEVCLALHDGIGPGGVAVALQCWHIQFPGEEWGCPNQTRGLTKEDMQGWLKVSVCSGTGVFENENEGVWGDFIALLKLRGIEVDKIQKQSYSSQFWCPSRSLNVVPCNGHKDTWTPSNGEIVSKSEHTRSSMISAVAAILASLGEDPSRKELVGTPHRFVQWLMNLKCSNMEMKLNELDWDNMGQLVPRTLRNMEGVQFNGNRVEVQAELNLPFWSQCEHHLLPFHGVVHVGYFHWDGEPIGKSLLQSVVDFHGSKLQVQERLTRQIAETISSVLGEDVMVMVEANHICMISRGIEKVGSSTATIATMGRFSGDRSAKEFFLQTVSKSTASRG